MSERFEQPDWSGALSTLSGEELRAMEFLREYLPPSDLWGYPAELFLQFVRHGVFLRKTAPWCGALDWPVFAHYVLFPRVNDEDLSFHREIFYDALWPRVKELPDGEARVQEVNRWCRERAIYQAQDERTASPLTVYRCGSGRCGEESAFLVSALRSVGVPARQVYAPRWSHCDDNHAWVEAYDGEDWRFLGACEPEPRLDLGWFIPAAGRAMLCHAKCFVGGNESWQRLLPGEDPRDVDLREGIAYISVTQRYAKVNPFTVLVTDVNGNPLIGAAIEYYVLNEGQLRRIAQRTTDSRGQAALNLGLGSLWVTARQGAMSGELLVNTAETSGVELRLPQSAEPPASFDFLPPECSSVKPLTLSEPERLLRQETLGRAKDLYAARHPGGGSVPKKPELWPWQRFPEGEVPELWQDGLAHDTELPRSCKLTLLQGSGKGSLGLMRWDEGWRSVPAPPCGCGTELPAGKYRLITSARLPNGAQLLKLTDFTLSPGESLRLTADFRQGTPDQLLQSIPMPDPGFSFEGPALLCWIDPGAEPTEHLLNELAALGEFPCPLHFICQKPPAALPQGAALHPWDGYVAETMARRLFQEPGNLPLAVLADKEGLARFASAGYNVGLIELAAELCGLIK